MVEKNIVVHRVWKTTCNKCKKEIELVRGTHGFFGACSCGLCMFFSRFFVN